jgi:nitrite reductase/ring-hydroxylating ferredoxin subunit
VTEVSEAWRLRPNAPRAGQALCAAEALPEGVAREVVFGAGVAPFSMLMVRRSGRVHAYLNLCPHFSLPLNQRRDAFLTPDGDRLMCTQHLAVFRIEDGVCVEGACVGARLEPIAVAVEAGVVRIA